MNGSVFSGVKGIDTKANNAGSEATNFVIRIPKGKIFLMGIHKSDYVPDKDFAFGIGGFVFPLVKVIGSNYVQATYNSQFDAGAITGWSLIGYTGSGLTTPDWVTERFDITTITATIPIQ